MATDLWVYADNDIVPDSFINELKILYPYITIIRASSITEWALSSPSTTKPSRTPYVSGQTIDFPDVFRDEYLKNISGSDWESNPTLPASIDLGVLDAVYNGDIGAGVESGTAHFLDLEPPAKLLTSSDASVSTADKQSIIDGLAALREHVYNARPDLKAVTYYRLYPEFHGRSATENATASKMLADMLENGLTGLDTNPLYGENSFYPSGDDWNTISLRHIENIQFGSSGLKVTTYPWFSASLYPDNRMLEPDDPRLVGSAAEGVAGGFNLWRTYAKQLGQLIGGAASLCGVLRRWTLSGATETTGYTEPGELPFDETYWRQMVAYIKQDSNYNSLAVYAAGSGSLDADLGNGTTLRNLLMWAAEELAANYDNNYDGLPDDYTGDVDHRYTARRQWIDPVLNERSYRSRRRLFRPEDGTYSRDDH